MKISVITVCFNAILDIEMTIHSVINQSYKNIEYIIIDGGSTDGTLEIIYKYKGSIDVIVTEPDNGIFDAMNKGIKLCTGTWVNFMNAGDRFYSLETIKDIFEKDEKYSKIGVIYGSTITSGLINRPHRLSSLKYGGIMACHQSIFYNRDICKKELYYKTKHKYYGDIELTRRLFLKKVSFQEVPIIISNYKGEGFSSKVSTSARLAKFSYLFQNMGFKGIVFGIFGKLIYIRKTRI
ncbi:glycosyltransferase family 2 protein [Algoriphagus boritolerans]|uniref:glycosyltransferase family 2 protein n=1 Tax=Algoriphagus boritolerans TaxID=308111 RepID=UPI00190E60E1|nr:glycosyltransferase family 2 protein [Algoriphagus boritolerans]